MAKYATRPDDGRKKPRPRQHRGICYKCGTPLPGRLTCCDQCMSDHGRKNRERRAAHVAKGLCGTCGKRKLYSEKLCRICCLKGLAAQRLGSRKLWKQLGLKLAQQGYLCLYTGIRILEKYGSSDHIISLAKKGPNTLDNIEWTHLFVNLAKQAVDKEDFIPIWGHFVREAANNMFGLSIPLEKVDLYVERMRTYGSCVTPNPSIVEKATSLLSKEGSDVEMGLDGRSPKLKQFLKLDS